MFIASSVASPEPAGVDLASEPRVQAVVEVELERAVDVLDEAAPR